MPAGLLLSDDLLFSSRITATARALGFTVAVARSPAALLAYAAQKVPGGVILDLQFPGIELEKLISELAALHPPPLVTGYGSHVDAETLKAARALGVHALPRSQFAKQLEGALAGWLKVASTS